MVVAYEERQNCWIAKDGRRYCWGISSGYRYAYLADNQPTYNELAAWQAGLVTYPGGISPMNQLGIDTINSLLVKFNTTLLMPGAGGTLTATATSLCDLSPNTKEGSTGIAAGTGWDDNCDILYIQEGYVRNASGGTNLAYKPGETMEVNVTAVFNMHAARTMYVCLKWGSKLLGRYPINAATRQVSTTQITYTYKVMSTDASAPLKAYIEGYESGIGMKTWSLQVNVIKEVVTQCEKVSTYVNMATYSCPKCPTTQYACLYGATYTAKYRCSQAYTPDGTPYISWDLIARDDATCKSLASILNPTAPPPSEPVSTPVTVIQPTTPTVGNPPTAAFLVVIDNTACERQEYPSVGETVTFRDMTAGNPTSRKWDWGDGSSAVDPADSSHKYSQAGVYTVKLTASNQYGSTTYTFSVRIGNKPSPNIQATPTNPIAGQATKLEDVGTGEATLRRWTFSDGSQAIETSAKSVSKTFTAAGRVKINLYVEGAYGCANTTKDITIGLPTTSVIIDEHGCRNTLGEIWCPTTGKCQSVATACPSAMTAPTPTTPTPTAPVYTSPELSEALPPGECEEGAIRIADNKVYKCVSKQWMLQVSLEPGVTTQPMPGVYTPNTPLGSEIPVVVTTPEAAEEPTVTDKKEQVAFGVAALLGILGAAYVLTRRKE